MKSLAVEMNEINHVLGAYIDQHRGLRQIIDSLFVTTKTVYNFHVMLMVFGFFIPFLLQIF